MPDLTDGEKELLGSAIATLAEARHIAATTPLIPDPENRDVYLKMLDRAIAQFEALASPPSFSYEQWLDRVSERLGFHLKSNLVLLDWYRAEPNPRIAAEQIAQSIVNKPRT